MRRSRRSSWTRRLSAREWERVTWDLPAPLEKWNCLAGGWMCASIFILRWRKAGKLELGDPHPPPPEGRGDDLPSCFESSSPIRRANAVKVLYLGHFLEGIFFSVQEANLTATPYFDTQFHLGIQFLQPGFEIMVRHARCPRQFVGVEATL